MSQENKKMRFKYVFNGSYNPVFVNGAYGGSSPKGKFVINFYHERIPVPKSLTYQLNEDGTLGELEHGKPSGYEDNHDPLCKHRNRYELWRCKKHPCLAWADASRIRRKNRYSHRRQSTSEAASHESKHQQA